ncbi:hypothetical protein CHCC20335_2768 [Bacillus paralicheniformis]|nr:hypothetical protein CHCC20335_2768 [Bacillus paralicheniformis]
MISPFFFMPSSKRNHYDLKIILSLFKAKRKQKEEAKLY